MIRRRCWITLLLLWAGSAAADWRALTGDCLNDLNRLDASPGTLPEACPDLADALRADPWGDLLVLPVTELPAWGVEDLAVLAQRYSGDAAGPRVDVARLDAALAALPAPEAEAAVSLWVRVLQWLREKLGGAGADWPDWLKNLSVPDSAAEAILIGSVLLITVLALAVVVNELRHYHRRRVSSRQPAMVAASDEGAWRDAAGDDSAGAQLTRLFEAVAVRLQELGLLPARHSLTHREVAAAPGLPDRQRQVVERLARAAERARYGAWQPGSEELVPLHSAGTALLDDLAGAARE